MKIREAKRQRNTEGLRQLRTAAAKLLRNKKRNMTATKTKIHRKKELRQKITKVKRSAALRTASESKSSEDSRDDGPQDDQTCEEGAEGNAWRTENWYWDQTFSTWVFTGSKRVRKRDLTNELKKNWVLGMRRNWNTAKKAKMVANISIKRDNMSMVTYFHLTTS